MSTTAPGPAPGALNTRLAAGSELSTREFHDLLKLRVDVFVVEQECPYPELDGRDLRADTTHIWLADPAGGPLASLRILTDPDGKRIGRVVTDESARGRGLASTLMRAALDAIGSGPVVLDAQTYLVDFYRGFGFAPTGPEFVEDGIPHVPMRAPGESA